MVFQYLGLITGTPFDGKCCCWPPPRDPGVGGKLTLKGETLKDFFCHF